MDINWTTLILGGLSPVAALSGVFLTLYFQARRDRVGAGLDLATDLLVSADTYYYAVKRSASDVLHRELNDETVSRKRTALDAEDAKNASRRWDEAAARASVLIRSRRLRSQIETVTTAIGQFERAYFSVERDSRRRGVWAEFETERQAARAAIDELRRMLRRRLARRF